MNFPSNWGAMKNSGWGVTQENFMSSNLREVCPKMGAQYTVGNFTQRHFVFNQSWWPVQCSGLHQHSSESRGSNYVKFGSQICVATVLFTELKLLINGNRTLEFPEYHGQRTVLIWSQSITCGPMLKDSFSPWLCRLRARRKLLSMYGMIFLSFSCTICISRCLQELNSVSETRDTPQVIWMSKICSNCWILVDCYGREISNFEWAFRLLFTYCIYNWICLRSCPNDVR